MSKSVHLICRRDDGVHFNGLTLLAKGSNRYRSCCWAFEGDGAASLVGGWIYLHEKKAEESGFGGIVQGGEPAKRTGYAIEDGFAVVFEARKEGKKQPWRGASHSMAWTGGFIDLTFQHEKDISDA